MFAATSIIKNSDKEKWVFSDNGISLDGVGSLNFSNDFVRNVIIFGVIIVHHKNNFSVLGEGSTSVINGSFGSIEKMFSINVSKASTKFCLSLNYNGYLFVNEKEIFKFKSNNGNVSLSTRFCLESISKGFGAKYLKAFKQLFINYCVLADL